MVACVYVSVCVCGCVCVGVCVCVLYNTDKHGSSVCMCVLVRTPVDIKSDECLFFPVTASFLNFSSLYRKCPHFQSCRQFLSVYLRFRDVLTFQQCPHVPERLCFLDVLTF